MAQNRVAFTPLQEETEEGVSLSNSSIPPQTTTPLIQMPCFPTQMSQPPPILMVRGSADPLQYSTQIPNAAQVYAAGPQQPMMYSTQPGAYYGQSVEHYTLHPSAQQQPQIIVINAAQPEDDRHSVKIFYIFNIMFLIISLIIWVFAFVPMVLALLFTTKLTRMRKMRQLTGLFWASFIITLVITLCQLTIVILLTALSKGIMIFTAFMLLPYVFILIIHTVNIPIPKEEEQQVQQVQQLQQLQQLTDNYNNPPVQDNYLNQIQEKSLSV